MSRPEYRLERQMSDGTSVAEIVPVTNLPWDTTFGRRGLFGAGLAVTGVVEALGQVPKPGSSPQQQSASTAGSKSCELPEKRLFAHSFGARIQPLRPADTMLATMGVNEVKLWNLGDLKLVRAIQAGDAPKAVFLGTASVAVAGQNGGLSFWSLPGGTLIKRIAGLKPGGATVFSPDRAAVLVEREDGSSAAYRLSDGETILTLPDPLPAGDSTPAFTPDGTRVVTLGERSIRLSPLAAGASAGAPLEFPLEGKLVTVAFSPDSAMMATAAANRPWVQLWNARTGEPTHRLRTHWDWKPTYLAFAGDGKWILTGSAEGELKLWSTVGGLLLWSHDIGDVPLQVELSSDNSRVLATANSTAAGNRNVYGRRMSMLISIPGGAVLAQQETQDVSLLAAGSGNWVVGAGDRSAMQLRSITDGSVVKNFDDAAPNPRPGPVGRMTRQPSASARAFGNRLLAEMGDNTVLVWNLLTGTSLPPLQGIGQNPLASAVYYPKGDLLFTTHGGAVAAWRLEDACFKSFLFDPAANQTDSKAVSYNVYDQVKQTTISYTMPCGSPIPAGATCTCNCVGGTLSTPRSSGGGGIFGGGGSYCRCNRVCTCIPISSRRWKRNIHVLEDALQQVEGLRGVRFDWTKENPQGRSGEDIGFIAEEVANTVPEVVFRDESGQVQGVDYARLTVLLVEAVKEQQRQIVALRGAVDTLLSELTATSAS